MSKWGLKSIKYYFIFIIFTLFVLFSGCSAPQKNLPVGGRYDKDKMESLIKPPKKISCFLQSMIDIADKKAKKKLITGRVLAWSSKIAISSGILELYIEEGVAKNLNPRLIKIIRIMISYAVPSPFAIDINSVNYKKFKITEEEIKGLQGLKKIDSISSFSKKEKVALKYVLALSKTPIRLKQKLLDELRELFDEKQILSIAALSAKVNYWTRLIEGLRIKPAGYTNDPILEIKKYDTYVK